MGALILSVSHLVFLERRWYGVGTYLGITVYQVHTQHIGGDGTGSRVGWFNFEIILDWFVLGLNGWKGKRLRKGSLWS